MKKTLLLISVCLAFTACKHARTTEEKQLAGRWVTTNEKYNREWFNFKQDGTFLDIRFGDYQGMMNAETYSIDKNHLLLKYRSLFVFHPVTRYVIISKTDSTLVLKTPGSKKYPSQICYLKKMKLHGKFIVE